MKKQELIHLHGLLAEVSNDFEKRLDREVPLEKYEALGVKPTSIHKSKTNHKEAVFALADGITSGVDVEESETVAPTAD